MGDTSNILPKTWADFALLHLQNKQEISIHWNRLEGNINLIRKVQPTDLIRHIVLEAINYGHAKQRNIRYCMVNVDEANFEGLLAQVDSRIRFKLRDILKMDGELLYDIYNLMNAFSLHIPEGDTIFSNSNPNLLFNG